MVGRLTDVYQGSLSRKAYNRPPGEFFGRPSFEPTDTNPGLPGNGGYPGNVDFRPPPYVEPRRPVVDTPVDSIFPTYSELPDEAFADDGVRPVLTGDNPTTVPVGGQIRNGLGGILGTLLGSGPGLPGNGGYPGNVDPIRPPSGGGNTPSPFPTFNPGSGPGLPGNGGYPGNVDFRPPSGGGNTPSPLPKYTYQPSNPGFGSGEGSTAYPGLPGNGGYPGNVDPIRPPFGGGGSNGGIQSLLSPLFSGLRDFQQQKFEPYAKQVTQLTNQTFPDYTSGSIGGGSSSATPFGGLGNLGVRPFSI